MSDGLLMSHIWNALDYQDGHTKTAAATGQFIRDRIRETSVLNRILPPTFVTEAEVERNTEDDAPLMRIDLEPDSRALTMGYRGRGEAKYWNGRRAECYFNKFESEHFIKSKEEMMTMRFPVRQVIEANFILDIQEALDSQFRKRLDGAALISGQVVNALDYSPDGSVGNPLTRTSLKQAVQMAQRMMLGGNPLNTAEGSSGRRRGTRLIMTESRWTDVAQLNIMDWGNAVNQITMAGNRDIKTFMGMDVVTSINARTKTGALETDNAGVTAQSNGMSTSFRTAPGNDPSGSTGSVWPEDSIYLVADTPFLGVNYILSDSTQEIKRISNILEWWVWQTQGFEIAQSRAVVRIDLHPV